MSHRERNASHYTESISSDNNGPKICNHRIQYFFLKLVKQKTTTVSYLLAYAKPLPRCCFVIIRVILVYFAFTTISLTYYQFAAPSLLCFHQQPGLQKDQQPAIITRTQSAQEKPLSPKPGSTVPDVAARSASAGQPISNKKPPTGRATLKFTNHFEKALDDLPAAKPVHKTSSLSSLVNAGERRRQQLESSTFGESITPLQASQKDSTNTLTVTMTTERKAVKQAYSNVDLVNQG